MLLQYVPKIILNKLKRSINMYVQALVKRKSAKRISNVAFKNEIVCFITQNLIAFLFIDIEPFELLIFYSIIHKYNITKYLKIMKI